MLPRYSEFTNLVLKLIKDKNLREEIGANARKTIKSFYTWEKTAQRAVQIYQTLIQETKNGDQKFTVNS